MKIKYRKWKKTRVLYYNTQNWDAEPSDLMCGFGRLFRLAESNGCNKAADGRLVAYNIAPPKPGMKAIIEDKGSVESREVYWIDEESWYKRMVKL